MERFFFYVSFAAYTGATALFSIYVFTRQERMARAAKMALLVGVACHVTSLLVRTVVATQIPGHGWHFPWSNWFESFSFFALIIVIEYWLIQTRHDIPILGAFVIPLAFVCLLVAVHSSMGMEISPMSSILRSPWMVMHVPVMFASYAAFANAFAVGVVYLIQERQLKSKRPSHLVFRMPALDDLDHLVYLIIVWAFPLLTLGLFLGAQWAHIAWGRYWGWDPKETSAFTTWLVYFVYLYLRWIKGWRGRRIIYLSLIGFVVVIVSYVGVNHVSPLHDFLSHPER